MKRGKLLSIILAFIAFTFIFLSDISSVRVFAADTKATDTTIPKVINIVYDDSGSMCPNGEPRWCRAKYALEVFTAMMGENDVINIYQMSEYDSSKNGTPQVIKIRGNDASRVSTVHNMNSNYTKTPAASVEAAMAGLQKESNDYDKWLVVLTDGAQFYTPEDSDVEMSEADTREYLTTTLNGFAKNHKVAYLAIGSAASNIESQSSQMMSLTAREGGDILKGVTEIANAIFEHQVLSDKFISGSNNYKLNIDIPTTQVIAFAQGADVSVGDMTLDGQKLSGVKMNVKYSDVLPLNKPNAAVDEKLKGVVVTYESEDEPFAPGTFEADISGADNIQFYYKAGVKAVCQIKDKAGNIVDASSGITEDDYEVKIAFVNPLNNEEIESELLNEVSRSVQITNNGKELDASSGWISLEKGSLNLKTSILLEGNVRIESDYDYEISPKAINLKIQLDVPDYKYKAQELNENSPPVIATIIDETTGTTITKEQWDACDVDVSGDKSEKEKYIEWEIKKGQAVGTYEIRAISKSDKNVTKISSGKHYFDVEAKLKFEGQKSEATENGSIEVEGYTGTKLVIETSTCELPVRIPALPDFEGLTATVYMIDDDSGEKVPISKEVWEALTLKSASPKTKRVNWTIEPGTEVGTFKIKPRSPFALSLFMYGAINGRHDVPEFTAPDGIVVNKASDISTTLKATGELGPLAFSGTGEAGMQISPLTWREIWSLIWKYVAVITAILIVVIIEGKKKRIYRRGMAPHLVYGKSEVDCEYRVRRVIGPFKAERATIYCNDSSMQFPIADMEIEAATQKSFRILNAEEITDPAVRIKDEVLIPADAEKLAKRKYAYSGYNMAPVAKAGKRVGMFHMSSKK